MTLYTSIVWLSGTVLILAVGHASGPAALALAGAAAGAFWAWWFNEWWMFDNWLRRSLEPSRQRRALAAYGPLCHHCARRGWCACDWDVE